MFFKPKVVEYKKRKKSETHHHPFTRKKAHHECVGLPFLPVRIFFLNVCHTIDRFVNLQRLLSLV